MRRSLLPAALCAAAAAAACAPAAAARVAIPVAHAARLQIAGLAGSVVVGDPAVADALVVDPHTIYVQGKAYGQTEIIVLDRAGRTIWESDVAVVSPDEGRVTLIRGSAGAGAGQAGGAPNGITEMTCSDVCSPVVAPPKAGKDQP